MKTTTKLSLFIIALFLLAITAGLASSRAFARVSAASTNLTKFSAADVSAYRWEALEKYYASQQAQIPVAGGNLTTLSSVDASAYRWAALTKFYAGRATVAQKYGPPGR